MTNIQKYKLVQSLSPAYSAAEIAAITGLARASVYHFRRKYQLPTEKESDHLEIAVLEASIRELEAKKRALIDAHIVLHE
ncbi:MAG: hypothetical protein CML08_02175 [Puniceicoccaceae bacterium]|nr:hypothetical protein [Puniceicoccaceae bacterium]|tara:strand:- start:5536 stop:5775 length:240 start_codon:yes stop_codon:yes gene_type:complete